MNLNTFWRWVPVVLLAAASLISCSDDESNDNGNFEVKTPTFQYTTTTWDDGWVSTIADSWVAVAKGEINVLLHYHLEGQPASGDAVQLTNAAWDQLVAPRYSDLEGYNVVSPSLDYERASLGYGTVTDNATKQRVFVALFRKGNSGWIEFVTPSKAAFAQAFGVNPDDIKWDTSSDIWTPMRVMANYNRFGVAASDIQSTGTWTNNFGANTFYYSMYTGLGVGMSTYSSTEEYTFQGGTSYQWQLFAANSSGGTTTSMQAKSSGKYSLSDTWSVNLSDIEGKPKTYQVWFAGVRGGRLLFIDGNPFSWVGE